MIADAGDNRLTLITSQTLLADSRYVVIADLVGRPVPTPEGRPAEVRSSELGINTEGSNVMALFLWLQLLADRVAGRGRGASNGNARGRCTS